MSKQVFTYASNLDFCSGFGLAYPIKSTPRGNLGHLSISGELRQRTDEGSAGNPLKSEIEIADADRNDSQNRHLSSSPRKRVRGERETCPLVFPSWEVQVGLRLRIRSDWYVAEIFFWAGNWDEIYRIHARKKVEVGLSTVVFISVHSVCRGRIATAGSKGPPLSILILRDAPIIYSPRLPHAFSHILTLVKKISSSLLIGAV